MTEAIETTEATEPAEWEPFPGKSSIKFELDKQVNQAQLHQELEDVLDHPVQLSSSVAPGQITGTLWIVPGSVNAETVQQILDDHEADPNWGVPQTTRDYIALIRTVVDDPDYVLSPEEIQTAVKGILQRMQAMG